MKVGDLVKVKSVPGEPIGIIVEIDEISGWPRVIVEDGRQVIWPLCQMELVGEK